MTECNDLGQIFVKGKTEKKSMNENQASVFNCLDAFVRYASFISYSKTWMLPATEWLLLRHM